MKNAGNFLTAVVFSILWVFIQSQIIYAHEFKQNPVVHMNKNGFEPKDLEIENGQTVVFENEDENPRWPASNIHPTHGIYPEFDPQKGIEPTITWKFKFDKTGRWKYHDHLIPQFTGTITVKEASNSTNIEDNLEQASNTKLSLFQKIMDFFKGIFSAFI